MDGKEEVVVVIVNVTNNHVKRPSQSRGRAKVWASDVTEGKQFHDFGGEVWGGCGGGAETPALPAL